MSPVVASTASDIDAAFLDRIIGGPQARVVGARVEQFGTGQMASTLRAHLQWSTEDPGLAERVIIKIVASDTGQRDQSRRTATYRREIEFYRQLSARLDVRTPTCLYAAIDETTGAFTLVLAEVPGSPGNQLAGCGADSAAAIVEAAVGLHVPLWGCTDELAAMPWLSWGDRAAQSLRAERYHQHIDGFIDRYRRRLGDDVLETALRLDDSLFNAFDRRRCAPCLVHNDFRIDNMVFSERDGRAVATVLDWQTVGPGSGPIDLAYAIGSSIPVDIRHDLEPRLLADYESGLTMSGITVSHEDVLHDYRLGTLDGLVMAVVASQVVARTPRGDEMFAVMAERHALHMRDHHVDELIT